MSVHMTKVNYCMVVLLALFGLFWSQFYLIKVQGEVAEVGVEGDGLLQAHFDPSAMLAQIQKQYAGDPEGMNLALQALEIMKENWVQMKASIEDGKSKIVSVQMPGISSDLFDTLEEDSSVGEYIPFNYQDGKVHLSRLAGHYLSRNPGSLQDYSQLAMLAQAQGAELVLNEAEAWAWLAEGTPPLVPRGFIFHMSHCGSTLAADLLAALPGARVYYEPAFLEDALRQARAGGRPRADQVALVRLLVGLLGKVQGHKSLFVKFQPHMTWFLPVIQDAFPDTPWIFLYRNPVEVLVSLLVSLDEVQRRAQMSDEEIKFGQAFGMSKEAYCLSNKTAGGSLFNEKVLPLAQKLTGSLSPRKEDICAAYLAAVIQPVLDELIQEDSIGGGQKVKRGKAVPYQASSLADWLVDYIFPGHFQLSSLDPEIKEKMKVIAAYKTKAIDNKRTKFKDDGPAKQQEAWKELIESSSTFLDYAYFQLMNYIPL